MYVNKVIENVDDVVDVLNNLENKIKKQDAKIDTLNLYIDVINNKVNNNIVVDDNSININKLVEDVYNACNYGNFINKNDLKELINKHITLSDERSV
jgi:hypothetical protein